MRRNKGICELTAGEKNGKTVLCDSYYTAPFKLMNPFQSGNKMKAIVMTASAGMLAGDDYIQKYVVRKNADMTVTGQGYTKIFNTKEDCCTNTVAIEVEGNGVFRYLPHPCIPFSGSDYRGTAEVQLAKDSTFVYMDILLAGRAAGGELFQMKRYSSKLRVQVENRTVFLDRMLLEPWKTDYRTIGFFGEHTHAGMMFLYRPQKLSDLLEEIRQMRFSGRFAATRAKEGILIRALADRGEDMENFFLAVSQMV